MCDLLHAAQQVPTVPVQRVFNVAAVDALRNQLINRPSWCGLFVKAYALVAAEMPVLRRSYLSFPWARLYEHNDNVASVAVERMYEGEPCVFFAHIDSPEKLSLADLGQRMVRYKTEPIESIPDFTGPMNLTRLPTFIRRFGWWYLTNADGGGKSTWLGTFGVSVYSSLGAESLHPKGPLTTTLNYGVIKKNGEVGVRVVYDHRVMDGATVARALGRLEEVLNQQIYAELQTLLAGQAPVSPELRAAG
jgi:pyruvate/2-oxoglutarate dehydrogenase complex dihydrolipoamide acyltransferase (E2) component